MTPWRSGGSVTRLKEKKEAEEGELGPDSKAQTAWLVCAHISTQYTTSVPRAAVEAHVVLQQVGGGVIACFACWCRE